MTKCCGEDWGKEVLRCLHCGKNMKGNKNAKE